ncbi:unnamed protein product [Merluccius merluccius]
MRRDLSASPRTAGRLMRGVGARLRRAPSPGSRETAGSLAEKQQSLCRARAPHGDVKTASLSLQKHL